MKPEPQMKLALFDLDQTLLPLDSDQSWGEFTLQLGWVDETSFRQRNNAFYADYNAGCLDIPITSRSPNHQLHCSASVQISFLFYLSD